MVVQTSILQDGFSALQIAGKSLRAICYPTVHSRDFALREPFPDIQIMLLIRPERMLPQQLIFLPHAG
jgi:hypothetical protein